jgi:hypothetical protein
VLADSGLSEAQFIERLESGGPVADVYAAAAGQATGQGDPGVWDVLSRLVTAALLDDSRIDTVSHLLTRLARLDPLHVRILGRFPPDPAFEPEAVLRAAGRHRAAVEASWPGVEALILAEASVVEAALGELRGIGFVREDPVGAIDLGRLGLTDENGFSIDITSRFAWRLTGLGRTLRKQIDAVHTLVRVKQPAE